MLKPALARGELRAIGATTLNEYRKYIEKDAALERRFQIVYVGEPNVEDTIAILARPARALRSASQRAHQGFGDRGRGHALASLYLDRFLPDKAIDLVDEAAASLAIQIGSVPTEVDQLEREQLRSKSSAPRSSARPTPTASRSQDRARTLHAEGADQQPARALAAGARAITRISELKKKMEALRFEAEEQTRKGQLERAAQIQYGELPRWKPS
jgi:ATP-dependent Clp protease ATP-binding subunit ClpB